VGSAPRSRVLQNAVLTLLLVVMGLALLYAYRSQTPAVPEVDLTKALQDINAGQVRAVNIAGARATLEPDTILARAVTDYNAAHPSQQIELKYQADTQPPLSVVGSVVLSLLPVLLIGGFFYYLMREARRRS
jgi:ATP-dependent Zn protease